MILKVQCLHVSHVRCDAGRHAYCRSGRIHLYTSRTVPFHYEDEMQTRFTVAPPAGWLPYGASNLDVLDDTEHATAMVEFLVQSFGQGVATRLFREIVLPRPRGHRRCGARRYSDGVGMRMQRDSHDFRAACRIPPEQWNVVCESIFVRALVARPKH